MENVRGVCVQEFMELCKDKGVLRSFCLRYMVYSGKYIASW